jgi:DNA mismatch endonuclease (patch repair protein)
MADVLSKKKRSEVMAAVCSKGNRATELKLISIFLESGITGWRRNQRLTGKPDFVFHRERLAVFVDGCFWHGCPIHGELPATNRKYWRAKLARNKARDRQVAKMLRNQKWRVLRLWEHSLRNPSQAAMKIRGHPRISGRATAIPHNTRFVV